MRGRYSMTLTRQGKAGIWLPIMHLLLSTFCWSWNFSHAFVDYFETNGGENGIYSCLLIVEELRFIINNSKNSNIWFSYLTMC